MINLKEIKTVTFDDDKMPTKWDDLDWENPMINDPRYLYSIHAAMTERVCKERTYPVSNTNDIWLNNHLDEFTFHKGELFSYRYFECLYSWVLNYLQDFINPNTVSRAWKFVDGEYTAAPQLMQYNDAEFSEILGYNFRELPLSFQPYEYYAKFPSISSTDTPFVSEIKAGDITWFEGWHALSIATKDVSIAPHTVNYLGHIEEELDLTTAKIQLEVADIENS